MSAILKKHFWKWFQNNHQQYPLIYKKSKHEQKYWMDELSAHLKAYCKKLDFALYFHTESRYTQLVISACGNPLYFRRVELLVKQAPQIKGWTITAFQHPMPVDYMIHDLFGDTGIDPFRLWFKPHRQNLPGNKLGITVYSELFRPEMEEKFTDAVAFVLRNILGEKGMGLNIGLLKVNNLSTTSTKEKLRPLEFLPLYIKSKQLQFEVNNKGVLKERIIF